MFKLMMKGVVKKEQTVLEVGWGEVNEAITVMDYTESQDAVLYPLSAGALRSLEGKKKKNSLVSLSSSVCVPFDRLSSGIEFFFHLFLFMCFGVGSLSEMSR